MFTLWDIVWGVKDPLQNRRSLQPKLTAGVWSPPASRTSHPDISKNAFERSFLVTGQKRQIGGAFPFRSVAPRTGRAK